MEDPFGGMPDGNRDGGMMPPMDGGMPDGGMDAGMMPDMGGMPEQTGNKELDKLIGLLQSAGPKQLETIRKYAESMVDDAGEGEQAGQPEGEMPEGAPDMQGQDMVPQDGQAQQ